MVKRTNLGLIAVAVMVVLAGAGAAQADLTDGLIAHWKLDETSGDTAYDSAGDNDGTLVDGPVWTSGQIDGALDFDGVDDYVLIGDKFNDVDIPFSMCAWINTNGGVVQSIFNSDDTGDPDSGNYYGWLFHLWSDDTVHISLGDGTGAGSVDRRAKLSSSTIPTGQWTFVAAVVRGLTDMDLYINGQDAGGYYDGTGGAMVHSDYPAKIGMTSRWQPKPFNGTIDDVRIYNRALSADEIEQIYRGELTGLEIEGPDEVAEDSQVQYKAIASYEGGSTKDVTDSVDCVWSVDDEIVASIGTDGLLETSIINRPAKEIVITAEYSAGGIDATDEKAVTVVAICPIGGALDFNSVDNDYVDLDQTPDLKVPLPLTLMTWVKLETAPSAGMHTIKIGGRNSFYPDNYYGHNLMVGPTGIGISYCDGGPPSSTSRRTKNGTTILETGRWYHIAGVIRGPEDMDIYIDAVDDGGTYSGTGGDMVYGDGISSIGSCEGQRDFFNGTMDEVVVYNRSLSAEEVQANMNEKLTGGEEGLVGYWDFDEGEGQVVEDLAGENDGTLGSDPNEVDSSDPAWTDDTAMTGYCSLGDMVGRNMAEVLEIKESILSQLAAAILIELDTYEMLDEAFEADELGTDNKNDVVKAKQKIHSAIQYEAQAGDDVQKSLDQIDDAYDVLGIE